ncbi:MAG: hypothetical protein AAFX05_00855 [Planctomycetota bacterium]
MRSLTLVAAASAATIAAPAWAQSFTNGDLTGPYTVGSAPPSWFNWQKTPDTCDATGPFNNTPTLWTLSPNGGTFVRAGGSDFPNSEAFAQNVSGFSVGQPYEVTFHLTNLGFEHPVFGDWNGEDGYWQLVVDGAVVGDSITLAKQTNAADAIVWTTDSINFVATSPTLEIAFVSRSTALLAAYMGIDGIRLTQVPAPGACATLGLAGAALVRRRVRHT